MVFLLIRFRTHSRQGRAGIFISEEHKKFEPFSYREKVWIFMVWCDREDSPSRALKTPHWGVSAPRDTKRGHGLFESSLLLPIKSVQNKKSSTP